MKIVRYGEKDTDKIILLLGFFDCLHKGHLKLIDDAKKTQNVKHCKIALFTFEVFPRMEKFCCLVKESKKPSVSGLMK